jgi:hypothetical protein
MYTSAPTPLCTLCARHGPNVSKIASELRKCWCAILGLNQLRLAKRQGRFRLICYLRTFVVAWTLADMPSAMRLVFAPDRTVRYIATGGNCP